MRRHATCCVLVSLLFIPGSRAQPQGAAVGSPPTLHQQAAPPPADQKLGHRLHLPIWIDRMPAEVRERMQLPFGIGMNFFGSNEDYVFSSASVSNGGHIIPSDMMKLDSLTTIQDSRTVRIDACLLPYLNVYLVGGTFSGTTRNIKASLVGMTALPLPQEIPFSGTDRGIGVTLAGGYESVFFTYDWNISWAKVDLATGHVPTTTQGPRIGVVSYRKNAQIDFYVGGFKEDISGNTMGSISFPDFGEFDYNVTVKPESAWNYVVGADVDMRKHCQISVEHGFGKRTHNMLSYTARF